MGGILASTGKKKGGTPVVRMPVTYVLDFQPTSNRVNVEKIYWQFYWHAETQKRRVAQAF
jgi:hypothetical protein